MASSAGAPGTSSENSSGSGPTTGTNSGSSGPTTTTTTTPARTLFTLPAELRLIITSLLGNASLLSLALTTRRYHHALLIELYTRTTIRPPNRTTTSTTGNLLLTSAADHPTHYFTQTNLHSSTDTRLIEAFNPFDPIPNNPLAPPPLDPSSITNLHRALFHALRHRHTRPLSLVQELAPAGFIHPVWIEDAVTRAAEERDVVFVESVLWMCSGLMQPALKSGRMLREVLETAELEGGRKGCFAGIVGALVRFVDVGENREDEGGEEEEEEDVVEKEEDVRFWEMVRALSLVGVVDGEVDGEGEQEGDETDGDFGLLAKLMAVGRNGCQVHEDPLDAWCFVDMFQLVVDKGLVDFRGVTKEMLGGWLRALPREDRLVVEHLLASAKGSLLRRP